MREFIQIQSPAAVCFSSKISNEQTKEPSGDVAHLTFNSLEDVKDKQWTWRGWSYMLETWLVAGRAEGNKIKSSDLI